MKKHLLHLSLFTCLTFSAEVFSQVRGNQGGKGPGVNHSMAEIPAMEKAVVKEFNAHIESCLNRKGSTTSIKSLKDISDFIYASEVSENFNRLSETVPSVQLCAEFKTQKSAAECIETLPAFSKNRINVMVENTTLNPYLQGLHNQDFDSAQKIVDSLKKISVEPLEVKRQPVE